MASYRFIKNASWGHINGEQLSGCDFARACDESESAYFAHARRYVSTWPCPYEPVTFFSSISVIYSAGNGLNDCHVMI